MLRGSCACGGVRYEIDGELRGPLSHCHCWQCRKHSGASFGTTAAVLTGEFRLVAGAEWVRAWESSPGIRRHFASCCGTPLYKSRDALPQALGLRLGTLDVDPGRRVENHIYVGSKVPWISLDDGLPAEPGGAPFPERET
jgi:hypothetical protein